jgi:molybdate transport system substrate-binding protein
MKKNILITFCSLILFAFCPQQKEKLTIAVAANLKSVMDSIIKIYIKEYPETDIQVTYGASGKFYEQIKNGAPFDLFFSADMSYPKKLRENGLTNSKIKMYGIGKIVLWSKKIKVNDLKLKALTEQNVKKIAIANPLSAPYGEKAIECFKKNKIYKEIKPKLVYGDNVSQAAQFAVFGAVEIAVIALSEVLSPAIKSEKGYYYIIPQENHSSLEQGCVILKKAKGKKSALKFFDFISVQNSINILEYFGYSQKVSKK